jgi:hypothetical protein
MKKMSLFLLGVAWLAAVTAQAAAPDLIAQLHFAGASQVSADTNAAAFTKLWCTPEAQALRHQTLNKLARAPYTWLKGKIPPNANDESAQLRPLLGDLSSAEWFLQIRDAAAGSPEYALAVRLDAGRAQAWQAGLKSVLEAWTGVAVEKKPDGWSLKKNNPPNRFQFVRVGDWVVFGCGQNELALNGELVRRITAEKRPVPADKSAWVTADLDWRRLARWFPSLNPLDLPRTRLRFVGRDRQLRVEGNVIFPQPPGLTLEPWRVPTDIIRQPVSSFTAVRGLAPWLKNQDWAQPYLISPVPNQMFIWAGAQLPLQTFAALPVPDGQKALREFGQKMSARPDWQRHFDTPVTMVVSNTQISWRGVPFVAPILRAMRDPAGEFLVGEFFPNSPRSKQPLPPELFQELSRTNLVLYHWEVTPVRLNHLPHLTQLALMSTHHRQFNAKSVTGKWLADVGPTLGTAVTAITQTAPNELSILRKAPGGLTAFELIALGNWLEATNFPGCDLRLPPRPILKRPPQKAPGATPAPAPGSARPPAKS